jgi:hypothetical protein
MEPTSGGMLDQTAGLAEPTDFPTNEDIVQNAVAVQGIIEVPHGHPSAIAQPGPRYKRGRGRSFFREPPKKGNCCQGQQLLHDLPCTAHMTVLPNFT